MSPYFFENDQGTIDTLDGVVGDPRIGRMTSCSAGVAHREGIDKVVIKAVPVKAVFASSRIRMRRSGSWALAAAAWGGSGRIEDGKLEEGGSGKLEDADDLRQARGKVVRV